MRLLQGLGEGSRYTDSLRAGRSGDRIPVRVDFLHPSRTALRPTQPLYSGYRDILGDNVTAAWRWPPTPSSAEVKERVQLCFYSPCVFMADHIAKSTFTITFFKDSYRFYNMICRAGSLQADILMFQSNKTIPLLNMLRWWVHSCDWNSICPYIRVHLVSLNGWRTWKYGLE
jgi:hypothetical protein